MSIGRSVHAAILGIGLAAAAFSGMIGGARASVDISAKPTKNMSCSAGVCRPTANKAVLNVGDLASMLQAADVKVTTGSGAITIEVTAALSWASANRLTLDANCNVSFKAPVTVAGPGGLSVVTNDGGSGCDLLFFPGGKVDFWDLSSSLVINGNSYTLAKSLKQLAADVKHDPRGFLALANDYDASQDGTYTRAPVKTVEGTFEGLGHSVANLSIDSVSDAGLFHAANFAATLRDIDIANANVVCTNAYPKAGILTGDNYGIVENASASGSVRIVSSGKRGLSFVGGLVGINAGTIADSRAAVTVSASDDTAAGGLVGYSGPDALVERARASGNVSAGSSAFAGGLAGQAYAVDKSFATGAVSAANKSDAGGLAGLGDGVTDSYATGSVQGGKNSLAGGLIGSGANAGKAYSTGMVTGGDQASVGGFIGSGDDGLFDAYWDLDTSGIGDPSQGCGDQQDCPGVTGLTDAQLKSALPAGFDPATWGQKADVNNGYPYLRANPPQN